MATESFDATLSHREIAQRALSDYPKETFEVAVEFESSRRYQNGDRVYMQLCNLGRPSENQLRLAMRHMLINVAKNPWLGFFFTPADIHRPVKQCIGVADMGCPLAFDLWNSFNDRFGIADSPADRWIVRINEEDDATLGKTEYMVGWRVVLRVQYTDVVIYERPLRTHAF
jgi:hypothetical protein